MKIGELARRRGMRTSAVRYYESIGVLSPAGRVSGRRDYGEDAVDALRLVQALQEVGFTLAQIRALRGLPASQRTPTKWREEARAKLRELDASIRQLREARRTLAKSLDCACDGRADACPLVESMERSVRSRAPRQGRT
jgi:MerR family redox-sensitive transcriptional activator SoxR